MTADPLLGLPSAPLRLAVLQAEAIPADLAGNVQRAAGLVARAARQGARVAVLPELHLCGYDLPTLSVDSDRCEVTADGSGRVTDARLGPLAEAAVRGGTVVLVGAAVRRADAALTNSVLMADPSGLVSVAYDKQHLWQADEAELFTAGDGDGTVVEVDGWRLGMAVCYDMSFPEHARSAALSGAHAYLCPSAFAAGGEHRAAIYLAARALENTVYSVFCNPVGGPPSRPTSGGSSVYAPDGSLVGRTDSAGEQTILADLDPGHMARARGFLHMLAEQRARHLLRAGAVADR